MDKKLKVWLDGSTQYLKHYNPNHDKLGRFATSNGTSLSVQNATNSKEIDSGIKKNVNSPDKKIIKNDLENWNRDGICDLSFDLQGDPYLFAKKNGLKLDEQKIKEKYEASVERSGVKRKDLVAPFEISSFEKNNNSKYIKGDAKIESYWDSTNNSPNYSMTGKSSNRVWKSEKKSKNGVHLIEVEPMEYTYTGIAHDSGGLGIDKKKVKALDSFSSSKEVSNAIRKGRKMGVYNSFTETSERDWEPANATFGFDSEGNPCIVEVNYYHRDVTKDNHIVSVYFDKNFNFKGSRYDG